jgi:C4-dicarboxylate-specific signal transduction histidine kinase
LNTHVAPTAHFVPAVQREIA